MPLMPAIRIIGRWGDYRVGSIIRPSAMLRKHMLSLKVAELADESPSYRKQPTPMPTGTVRPDPPPAPPKRKRR